MGKSKNKSTELSGELTLYTGSGKEKKIRWKITVPNDQVKEAKKRIIEYNKKIKEGHAFGAATATSWYQLVSRITGSASLLQSAKKQSAIRVAGG